MNKRMIYGLLSIAVVFILAAFITMSVDVWNWRVVDRVALVAVSLAAWGMTVTCPFIDD